MSPLNKLPVCEQQNRPVSRRTTSNRLELHSSTSNEESTHEKVPKQRQTPQHLNQTSKNGMVCFSYKPLPHEEVYYQSLFRKAGSSNNPVEITKDEAFAFLESSHIPRNQLKVIWKISNIAGTNTLNCERFNVAVRLVQLHQNKQVIDCGNLTLRCDVPLKPAFFEVTGRSRVPRQDPERYQDSRVRDKWTSQSSSSKLPPKSILKPSNHRTQKQTHHDQSDVTNESQLKSSSKFGNMKRLFQHAVHKHLSRTKLQFTSDATVSDNDGKTADLKIIANQTIEKRGSSETHKILKRAEALVKYQGLMHHSAPNSSLGNAAFVSKNEKENSEIKQSIKVPADIFSISGRKLNGIQKDVHLKYETKSLRTNLIAQNKPVAQRTKDMNMKTHVYPHSA